MPVRSAAALFIALALAGCDTQAAPEASALVGTWVVDSVGTAESVIPVTDQTVVNFAALAVSGSASFDGSASGALDYGVVLQTNPDGTREAVFASYDPTGLDPEATPYYRLSVAGGPGASTLFELVEQQADRSFVYRGFLDGPPFTTDGNRLALPSAELPRAGGGQGSVRLQGGTFEFPLLTLVGGEAVTVRRQVDDDTDGVLLIRHVYEADGTYRIETFAPTGVDEVRVREAGLWTTDGAELVLDRREGGNDREIRVRYEVDQGRLELVKPEAACEEGQGCLAGAEASLSLPPGSIRRYEQAAVRVLSR